MEEYTIYLSEFQKQKIKTCFDSKRNFKVRITHKKVNKREPVRLLPRKRQVTKIEKYKNENKGCDIDLSF